MNQQIYIEHRELFLEITRYLAAVDLYRSEHCEPTWRPQSAPFVVTDEGDRARAEQAPSAR